MATKRQKEFKRQMRELEKEGKLPNNYYSRRRFKYTGGGVSILLVLFVLWQSGILGFIISPVFMLLNMGQNNNNSSQMIAGDFQNPASGPVSDYCNANIDTDEFISDVYIDIYKHFYENKPVEKETFISYQETLPALYKQIETESELLKNLSTNYQENLTVSSDMIDFALAHYDNPLAEDEKRYLDTLTKKSLLLSDKRPALLAELDIRY